MGDSVTTIARQYVVSQSTQPASPFEGQLWIDTDNGNLYRYINGSWAKVGANTAYIDQFLNDAAALHERHDLELSINAWNYDDGFIDIFWDESKVASKSLTEVTGSGSDGAAKLQDGQNNNTAGGVVFSDATEYTYGPTPGGGSTIHSYDMADQVLYQVVADQWASVDGVWMRFNYADGSSATVEPDNYTTSYITSTYVNPNVGKTVQTVDAVAGRDTSWGSSKEWKVKNFEAYTTGYASSGTLTHTRKDLGFTPSKIVANPDLTPNGQTADLIVRDNSGNSVTFTQAELGDEKTVGFSDGNLQLEWQFSSDGTDTPVVETTKLLGVQ